MMPKNLDPLKVNERLYRQVAELLHQLEEGEHVTLKERCTALAAIARIQYIFVGLRKESLEDDDAGTTVRKYSQAFTKNDTGRGKKGTRSAAKPKPEPDDWFEHAELDDDDNAA